MNTPTNQAAHPDHIGPYELLERIGRGGMGSVYLAWDQRQIGAQRWAAVKIIHEHLGDDPTFTKMFLDEARIASEISHPNVCRVIDYGSEDSTRYLAMEYLCGATLSAVRQHVAQSADTGRYSALPGIPRDTNGRRAALMAYMVTDACEGLHAIHELTDEEGEPLDIVHRDVSPDNLIVTCSGTTKVVDFGTVKARHQEHTTKSGAIKGKFSYMPPEVLLNLPTDRRGDIWALGVIAWEVLTGQRLFKRETEAKTLQAVLNHPVPRPSRTRADVPRAFDEPVLRALARDPQERFASARAFGRALRRAAHEAGFEVDSGDVQQWLVDELEHDTVCRRHGGQPASEQRPIAAISSPSSPPPPMDVESPVSLPVTRPVPAMPRVRRWPSALLGAVGAAVVLVGAWLLFRGSPSPSVTSDASSVALGALTHTLGARLADAAPLQRLPMQVELRTSDGEVVLSVPLEKLMADELAAQQPQTPPLPAPHYVWPPRAKTVSSGPAAKPLFSRK